MPGEFEDLVKRVDTRRTKEEHHKLIKELAENAFKDHEITVEAYEKDENGQEYPTRFRCGKPTTIVYSYRVCFLPLGVILVYGDIGDMMLQNGGYGWLKGSVCHDRVSDYVMSKIRPVPDWRSKEFMSGDALKELRQMHDGVPFIDKEGINFVEQAKAEGEPVCDDDWEVKPDPELAIKIAEDWLLYDQSGHDGHAWSRANYEHASDYWEGPYCLDYTADQLWCYYALSWFVRKWEEMQSKEAA